jgi:pimeloyl-ACP methyl ester carboxylesterase
MAAVELATHEWMPHGAGDAPLAVLVHGVLGWWRTWWRVGPALADRGFRVVAVDQRGHGDSPRIDGRATIGDFAEDLADAIAREGGRAHGLVGHSLGGAVGAELAFTRPDLVDRLVIEDPPAHIRAGDSEWLDNVVREVAAARDDFDGEVARELAANPAWAEEDARQDIEGKQLADDRGIVASLGVPNGSRVPEIATRLGVPTLFLLGAAERSVYTGEPRRRLRAGLPAGSRVVELDAGHTIHRDRFEEYVSLVAAWLAR